MKQKLRVYRWTEHEDAEYSLAILAPNLRRAKELGYSHHAQEVGVEPETFIEQRCTWMKYAQVPKDSDVEGVIDGKEGVRRGYYSWYEEDNCDGCNNEAKLYSHNGKALCEECVELEDTSEHDKVI